MPSDSSSRHWWSFSKHSFASAIGLKKLKKQRPSLAIQDPPPALLSSSSNPTPFTYRPSLSARSRVDSTGPPTPVDSPQRDECRESLLTLSDTDPFAGRPLIIPPVPQLPSKKTFDTPALHRFSCASSSSQSTNTCDASTISPVVGQLSNKRSIKNIQVSRPAGSADSFIRYTPFSPSFSSKSQSSSSTLVTGGSTNFAPSRPKLRARGMTTDGGGTQKAGFFLDDRPKSSPKSSTSTFSPTTSSMGRPSPRVVVRHASLSRLFAPPCAPPKHSLPATPQSPAKLSSPIQRTQSISSSCMSFVSASSNEVFPALEHSLRLQDRDPEITHSPVKTEPRTPPSSPRTLKKPLSQPSLTGKPNLHPPNLSPDKLADRVLRKQRTFHRSRSPVPPIPDPVVQLSSPNSTTFPPLTDFGPKSATEGRASGNSLNRKRLFSYSSTVRSSICQCAPTPAPVEDDSQSVFSLRSDRSSHLAPFKPWSCQRAAQQSPSRDDAGSPVPSSPARSTAEYMPQPILSAAEVAKLEASIENSPDRSTRSRTFSHLSASTTASDMVDFDFVPAGLSPPPARPRSKGSMTGKSSKTSGFHSPVSSRTRISPRSSPPPINGYHENDSGSAIRYQPFASESTIGLPPPPRARQRSHLVSHTERPNPEPRHSSSVVKPSRSKPIAEKNMHRRSIMRKPSFLEIDDDTDQDIDLFSGEEMTQSFLDLARESYELNHIDDP